MQHRSSAQSKPNDNRTSLDWNNFDEQKITFDKTGSTHWVCNLTNMKKHTKFYLHRFSMGNMKEVLSVLFPTERLKSTANSPTMTFQEYFNLFSKAIPLQSRFTHWGAVWVGCYHSGRKKMTNLSKQTLYQAIPKMTNNARLYHHKTVLHTKYTS